MSDDYGSLLAQADWTADHPGEVGPDALERLVSQLAAAIRSLTPESPETRWAKEWRPDEH